MIPQSDLPDLRWVEDQLRRVWGEKLGGVSLDDDGLLYFVVIVPHSMINLAAQIRMSVLLDVDPKHVALGPSFPDGVRFIVNMRHDTQPETPAALEALKR